MCFLGGSSGGSSVDATQARRGGGIDRFRVQSLWRWVVVMGMGGGRSSSSV